MNGWLNLYKPRAISSAKAVARVKKLFKGDKIGHTGTLDPEAEGVLPLAIGQATKLVSILIDSVKQYEFTIQFGVKTTTADAAGDIVDTTDNIPSTEFCASICQKFIGKIEQTPPIYSALKINGVRAYKLARQNKKFTVKKRLIDIYNLKFINFDEQKKQATYIVTCSKGTYVRSLAEDISLSLQSLGFVVELRRTKVGVFNEKDSINIETLENKASDDFIRSKCLKVESVLDDIPVLEVGKLIADKVRFGQICYFDIDRDYHKIWLKFEHKIVAIGALTDGYFKSSRVFNYNDGE